MNSEIFAAPQATVKLTGADGIVHIASECVMPFEQGSPEMLWAAGSAKINSESLYVFITQCGKSHCC